MAKELLSDAACKAAKPRPNGKALILSDGGGLRLMVKPNGVKDWQVRFYLPGSESTLTIGRYPHVGLSEAREEARRIRAMVKLGTNPTTQRALDKLNTAKENDNTFKRVAGDWLQNKRDGIGTKSGTPISPSYDKKIQGILEANIYPRLGALPIQSITSPILWSVLAPIGERSALDMLNTTWRICREIFDTAKADGRFIGDNPATSLKTKMKKHVGENMRALPWEAMNGFLHRLDAGRLNPATIACIRLVMMTATRPGEARGATWAEFNLDAALWSIPAARMKTRKPHVIPLSHQCVAMLRTLHVITGHGEYLFPSQRGSKAKTLSDMGLLQGIRAVAGTDDVDAHGFRATFRTHAEEANLWTEAAMEGALGHGKKDAVKAAYDRAKHLPERTRLAQWYSDQLDLAQHGAQVIQLRA